VLVEQLVESIRRTRYPVVIKARNLGGRVTDPNDELFDPLKAALVAQKEGELEEAFWLVFLFVHFGKNRRGGWRYAREVYGRLGRGDRWDWQSVSTRTEEFRRWLADNRAELERKDPPGGFGNHRKYESLDAHSPHGTGAAVATYVKWVTEHGSHAQLVQTMLNRADGDPRKAFDLMYHDMDVARFGRTARFDYLTMLAKIDLAPIAPASAYIAGSTGPAAGARLLFHGDAASGTSNKVIEDRVAELDGYLTVGMQVLEDALCNWQKSPDAFRPFRG
jgi:hypothetical protein